MNQKKLKYDITVDSDLLGLVHEGSKREGNDLCSTILGIIAGKSNDEKDGDGGGVGCGPVAVAVAAAAAATRVSLVGTTKESL
ncbi:hypothetical protein LXL04_033614 [Taraxacum kok-saghyz]